jgi:hypothetical protein
MSLLDRLRGNGHETTAVAEKRGCLHTALTPRWDQLDDIGHEDRISEYVCEGCGERLTPEDAGKQHVTAEELVGPGPGEM